MIEKLAAKERTDRHTTDRRSLDDLARKIRSIETSGRPTETRISSGSVAMDALLPSGGYGAGTMIEWVHGGEVGSEHSMPVRGLGSLSLAMRVAIEGMAGGKYLVLVDRHRRFYAPGWIGLGGSPDRLIVLRPDCDADAIWGMDQALRNLVGLGVGLAEASRRTATIAAEHLGLTDRGRLAPGAWADAVVLAEHLVLQGVLAEGERVSPDGLASGPWRAG